jgi:hypothetical protein
MGVLRKLLSTIVIFAALMFGVVFCLVPVIVAIIMCNLCNSLVQLSDYIDPDDTTV